MCSPARGPRAHRSLPAPGASARGRGVTPAAALALQRLAGNRVTGRVLARWTKHPDPEKKGDDGARSGGRGAPAVQPAAEQVSRRPLRASSTSRSTPRSPTSTRRCATCCSASSSATASRASTSPSTRPPSEWSGKLTGPTVDLFLYDLREATERAAISPIERRGNGQAVVTMPPLQLELPTRSRPGPRRSRTSTGCSRRCSAILFSYPELPTDIARSAGTTARAVPSRDLGRAPARGEGRLLDVGRRAVQGVDRLRGAHRPSSPAATFVRGPEVRTQTHAHAHERRPAPRAGELHRLRRHGPRRGRASRCADAWVALPDSAAGRRPTPTGASASTGSARRAPKSWRAPSTARSEATVTVPGERVDLVLGERRRRRPARKG